MWVWVRILPLPHTSHAHIMNGPLVPQFPLLENGLMINRIDSTAVRTERDGAWEVLSTVAHTSQVLNRSEPHSGSEAADPAPRG